MGLDFGGPNSKISIIFFCSKKLAFHLMTDVGVSIWSRWGIISKLGHNKTETYEETDAEF